MPSANPPARATVSFGGFRETPRTAWRPERDAFAPTFELTGPMQGDLRRVERLDHDLARAPHATTSLAQRLRRETLARNAYATASIEGNPLSLSQVESLLAHPSPAATHEPDELEILNYAQLMESAQATRAPREPADVLDVHARLFRGVFADAGAWKSTLNFIGNQQTREVVYVPARPERVERELAAALAWLHNATDVPPLARALLFHHEFESIHPFRDGNGRAGRALTPMALHEFGYAGSALAPIDFVLHERRQDYYANLARVERDPDEDYTPWLAFMLAVVRDAYERGLGEALFQSALPDSLSARQRQVAEWFGLLAKRDAQARVKFNDVHNAFPQVAERTLKRDLATLREAGLLHVEGVLKGTTYRLAPALTRA